MGIDRNYWVYILASDVGGTLYIGVTNDLVRRVYEHRTNAVPGFSGRYGVHRLVYYEQFGDIEFAIRCKKRLKKWSRAWKN
jgi:putative endonuclease